MAHELETQLVARCIEPGCNCLDRAGIIIASPNEAPRGYEVREEIRGGLFAGWTLAEVMAAFSPNSTLDK